MYPLRRLLKPDRLRLFLEDALRLAPEDTTATVLEADGNGGFTPLPGQNEPPRGLRGHDLSLRVDGCVVGWLVLHAPDGAGSADLACVGRLAAFTRRALEEIIAAESARRDVAAETLDMYRELELLHRATNRLNSSLRLEDVTRALIDECGGGQVPAEMGVIFLTGLQGSPVSTFGGAQEAGLTRTKDTRLHIEVMALGRGEIVNDLARDKRWNIDTPGVRSLLIVPLRSPNLLAGSLVLASSREGAFHASHLRRMSTIAAAAAASMGNAHHYESIRVLMDALLQALATAIDARDPMTAGHSLRVARLSAALVRVVNEDSLAFADRTFSDAELHEIFYAGLLHDVGKIGVREEVLTKNARLGPRVMQVVALRLALYTAFTGEDQKPLLRRLESINSSVSLSEDDASFVEQLGRIAFGANGTRLSLLLPDEIEALLTKTGNLTPGERREIERHPEESYRILQHIPFTENFQGLLTIIHQHHERLDGSGYPNGLKGSAICMQARILAITDIYDAITQERHYKPALSCREALEVLRAEALRGRIDAALTALFCDRIDDIVAAAEDMETWRAGPIRAAQGARPD